jgi:hypothetical protein
MGSVILIPSAAVVGPQIAAMLKIPPNATRLRVLSVEVETPPAARFSPPAHEQGRVGQFFLVQFSHLEHFPFLH